MKKGYCFIALVLCIGLLLTWGVLRVSAIVADKSSVAHSDISIEKGDRSAKRDCVILDPHLAGSEPGCKTRDQTRELDEDRISGLVQDNQALNHEIQKPLNPNQARDGDVEEIDLNNSSNFVLSVYVENANGLPAIYADVQAFTIDGSYIGYAQTDDIGYAYLAINPGEYNIRVSSRSDHFFLYQRNVTAPGTLEFSAIGSSDVTLTTKKKDGTPLINAYVSVAVSGNESWLSSSMGFVGPDGTMVLYVQPGQYDIGVNDEISYYALYKTNLDFSDPNNTISFDTTIEPTADIIAGHPFDQYADFVVVPAEANLSSFYTNVPNGAHVIISADRRFWAYQWLRRDAGDGTHWYLRIESTHGSSYFPGEISSFTAGGTVSIHGRTEDVNLGDNVALTDDPLDSFGNYLGSVFTYTADYSQGSFVTPLIELTDPNGSTMYLSSTWYYFGSSSPIGMYQMSFEWDTGPFQGMLTTESEFELLPFNGLVVYVENADGEPAYPAWVYASDYEGNSDWSQTGQDGISYLQVPPGNYDVSVESWSDRLFIYELGISSPGSITLSAVGTPVVTLTAKYLDATPMVDATVLVEPVGLSFYSGNVGYIDTVGELIFHVTPGSYNVDVVDWTNYYYMYDLDLDLSGPGTVLDYDMSTRPTAGLLISHPYDTLSHLIISRPTESGHMGFGFSNVPDNSQWILSADRYYYPQQSIRRVEASGVEWNYDFYYDIFNDIYIGQGDTITFSVGGSLSVSGRTEDAYVGEWITLTDYVRDNFGSYLTGIYTHTAGQYGSVRPLFLLTDPIGLIRYNEWWDYYMPTTAPVGIYDMHFEWDTGEPYQGLLTTDSQFRVLPQQTSAIISPEGGTLYSSWDNTLYEFPPGTFTETAIVTHTVKYTDIPPYAPWVDIGHFYDVTAIYSNTGMPAEPAQPYTITIGYAEWQRGSAIEDSLGLFNWDGLQWVWEPTSTVDSGLNQLIANPEHFSTWGVLGETNRTFLPLITRP